MHVLNQSTFLSTHHDDRYTVLYNEDLERFIHGERLKLVRAQVRIRRGPFLLPSSCTKE